jgi:hypothetical protein
MGGCNARRHTAPGRPPTAYRWPWPPPFRPGPMKSVGPRHRAHRTVAATDPSKRNSPKGPPLCLDQSPPDSLRHRKRKRAGPPHRPRTLNSTVIRKSTDVKSLGLLPSRHRHDHVPVSFADVALFRENPRINVSLPLFLRGHRLKFRGHACPLDRYVIGISKVRLHGMEDGRKNPRMQDGPPCLTL